MGDECFKPEAHLLIEKFLSLKNENSLDLSTANMKDYTRGRRNVSSFFLALLYSMLNHFFSIELMSSGCLDRLVRHRQRAVEVVKTHKIMLYRNLNCLVMQMATASTNSFDYH